MNWQPSAGYREGLPLLITIAKGPHQGSKLRMRLGGESAQEFQLNCPKGIPDQRKQVARACDELSKPGVGLTKEAVRTRLRQFLLKTWQIGQGLFDQNERLRLRHWLAEYESVICSVELEAPLERMIPMDLIPLAHLANDRTSYCKNLDQLSLIEMAEMVFSGRWPVSRRWQGILQPRGALLPNAWQDQIMRIAFIGDETPHKTRSIAQEMRRHFHRLEDSDNLRIEKHWPDPQPLELEVFMQKLAGHLTNPTQMPRGCQYPHSPASATHFFCHGQAANDDKAAGLQIGHKGATKAHFVSTKVLESALQAQASSNAGPQTGAQNRSLVFLNSCSGAEQSVDDHSSMVSVFANNAHPAVIGTETSIDIPTAHDVSAGFYEYLCQGVSAPEALFQTKRALLDESKATELRPSALIYCYYGLPNTCLPRRKLVIGALGRRS